MKVAAVALVAIIFSVGCSATGTEETTGSAESSSSSPSSSSTSSSTLPNIPVSSITSGAASLKALPFPSGSLESALKIGGDLLGGAAGGIGGKIGTSAGIGGKVGGSAGIGAGIGGSSGIGGALGSLGSLGSLGGIGAKIGAGIGGSAGIGGGLGGSSGIGGGLGGSSGIGGGLGGSAGIGGGLGGSAGIGGGLGGSAGIGGGLGGSGGSSGGFGDQDDDGGEENFEGSHQEGGSGNVGTLPAAFLMSHHGHFGPFYHNNHHFCMPDIMAFNLLSKTATSGSLSNLMRFWPFHKLPNPQLRELLYLNAISKSWPMLIKQMPSFNKKAMGL